MMMENGSKSPKNEQFFPNNSRTTNPIKTWNILTDASHWALHIDIDFNKPQPTTSSLFRKKGRKLRFFHIFYKSTRRSQFPTAATQNLIQYSYIHCQQSYEAFCSNFLSMFAQQRAQSWKHSKNGHFWPLPKNGLLNLLISCHQTIRRPKKPPYRNF